MIALEINGKKTEVCEGSTVMEAAHQLGIYIPHFCYHQKLSIAANCRMCLVDVEKSPKTLPACATPVSEGMIVKTHSPKAVAAQKSVMAFLLINHPLDCPICDQGGECQLQDLAVGYGSSASRYQEEKRVVDIKEAGPLISMQEMARCIQCTRCVRFGQEIAGVMEFGMLGRGEHAEITTFVGKTVDSELSGNMIDICPVGALTSKPFRYSARTWELSRRKSISPHDSLGTNLIMQVKAGRVMRVLPFENPEVNECWLSDKDRFAYEGLNSEERLTQPMLKQNGSWQTVGWEQALEKVATGLSDIRREHGANALGALGAPHATLEELFLLQKLWRGLGSDQVDFRARQSDFSLDGEIVPWLGMSIQAFSRLDRVLMIGSFFRKDHPLLAARLRLRCKQGAQLNIVHATDDDLLMPVAHKMIVAPSAWFFALQQIIVAVATLKQSVVPAGLESIKPGENAWQIAKSLLCGQVRGIFMGNAAAQHPQAAQLHAAGQWLAQQIEGKLGYLTEGGNTVGGYWANALPDQPRSGHVFSLSYQAYLLLHTEPQYDSFHPKMAQTRLDQAKMVVVLSAFKHGLEYADVLLPVTPFTETSGTFVNCEGRAQSFYGVVKPLGQARPAWKVLRVLGNLLKLDGFDYASSEQVREEVLASHAASSLNNEIQDEAKVLHLLKQTQVWGFSLERIADVPIYFSDPIVRRACALQQTVDAQPPKVWISTALARELNVSEGILLQVKQGEGKALLPCAIDPYLPDRMVRTAVGHASTASLGEMIGPVTLEVGV